MTIYLIIRKPCLMEDEGRYFPVRHFSQKEKAEAWIAAQEGKYFSPSDYYISEVPE